MTNGFKQSPLPALLMGLTAHIRPNGKAHGWRGTGKPKRQIHNFLRIEYHWADYLANADWNLRTDFAHP